MTNQEIINRLYLELLFVAVILIGILFINNIVLYKQKLKDRISIMLLTSVALGCFEILWAFCEGHPNLRVLTYIGACGYMILFAIFTVLLNRYILFRFNRLPKSKWANILFYIVPPVIFSVLCVTTPWTHWFVSVDEAGVLTEELLFDALFTPLMIIYVLIAVLGALSYAYGGKEGTATVQIAIHKQPLSAEITFIDSGVQYDPLAEADPDITLAAKERKKGGLGIYMVKNSMDDMKYEYKDGQNVLTVIKNL